MATFVMMIFVFLVTIANTVSRRIKTNTDSTMLRAENAASVQTGEGSGYECLNQELIDAAIKLCHNPCKPLNYYGYINSDYLYPESQDCAYKTFLKLTLKTCEIPKELKHRYINQKHWVPCKWERPKKWYPEFARLVYGFANPPRKYYYKNKKTGKNFYRWHPAKEGGETHATHFYRRRLDSAGVYHEVKSNLRVCRPGEDDGDRSMHPKNSNGKPIICASDKVGKCADERWLGCYGCHPGCTMKTVGIDTCVQKLVETRKCRRCEIPACYQPRNDEEKIMYKPSGLGDTCERVSLNWPESRKVKNTCPYLQPPKKKTTPKSEATIKWEKEEAQRKWFREDQARLREESKNKHRAMINKVGMKHFQYMLKHVKKKKAEQAEADKQIAEADRKILQKVHIDYGSMDLFGNRPVVKPQMH